MRVAALIHMPHLLFVQTSLLLAYDYKSKPTGHKVDNDTDNDENDTANDCFTVSTHE